ncbi:MAG: NFACT family protein [Lactobacillales bacterium]|nr:NFACT family protein [Lactobacillales bacterium]
MSFDGVFLHVLTEELQEKLVSGRVNKVHQPYEKEVVFVIRSHGKTHQLLFSAHPSYARVQLTDMKYQNPEVPFSFAMVLRKHLEGSILESIKQIENDRILHFTFRRRDELGDLQNLILIAELMGRHSTILLFNQATGKILDAIKHVGFTQNTYRTLLPGREYIAPPMVSGENPWIMKETKVFELLSTAEELDARFLQKHFQGLGHDTAEELVNRLLKRPNEKLAVWKEFWNSLSTPYPSLYVKEGREYFTLIPFVSLGEARQTFSNLSELLDNVFLERAEKERVKQQAGELLQRIRRDLKKSQKKLEKLQVTLLETESAEEYRRKGELLTTFLTQVPKGAKEVTLANYYEEDTPIVIALKPFLSVSQNAQKYFQKYQKLKIAVRIVKEQLQQTKQEILYLESVESQLELATPLEVPVIFEELCAEGYIKIQKKKRGKKERLSEPVHFHSSDGTEILVGKNNLQNDKLTLKIARKTDYWLHAKNIPGSHVIIRSSSPSDMTLTEAGILAAYYSKYRYSAQVPVDILLVKNIRKPNGAKAGFVIYEGQKTILVTPSEDIVKSLKD